MKKSIIVLLAVLFMIIGLMPVFAANIKELKLDTTYILDLNGGNKESIKVKVDYAIGDEGATWYLFVNDKNVASFECKSIVWEVIVYYIDVNKKDKYKEVFVVTEGNNNWLLDARIVRYCSDKVVKVMPLKNYVRRMRFASCDGKNNLYFWMDTPFFSPTFGCYYCKMRGYVSSKKISLKKQNKYVLEVPNMGLSLNRQSYELKTSMKLYKSASREKVKQTLKPGTKFSALEIKPTRNVFWNYNIKHEVYVKVKTTNGKNGWLLFPGTVSTNQCLVNTPAWG